MFPIDSKLFKHFYNYVYENVSCLTYGIDRTFLYELLLSDYCDFIWEMAEILGLITTLSILFITVLSIVILIKQVISRNIQTRHNDLISTISVKQNTTHEYIYFIKKLAPKAIFKKIRQQSKN